MGTITVTNGSDVVIGVDEVFLSTVRDGDTLVLRGLSAVIDDVLGNLQLKMAEPWPGATVTDTSLFRILKTGTEWSSVVTVNEQLSDVIQKIEAGIPFRADYYGSLAARAAFNNSPAGFIYGRTDVDPWVIYVKNSAASGDWSVGVSFRGSTGPTGSQGNTGASGRTIWNGVTAPSNALGLNDDLYLDTVTHNFYGPKAGGVWPAPFSLVGPSGRTILSGIGAPAGGTGVDGDFYLDTTAADLYGPKAGGVWPAGVTLVGPTGANGKTVRYGVGVPDNGLGVDADFYINVSVWSIYGPKAGGVWPAGSSMIGPANSLVIGTVGDGEEPYANITGTPPVQTLDLVLPRGNKGWSPEPAIVTDAARRVLRIVDWIGGTGDAPAADLYVGPDGFTAVLAEAVDLRGGVGLTGDEGPVNVITIGSVTSGPVADADISGTPPNYILDLILPQGDPGREIELSSSSTHLRWRYVGDVPWTNLVSLADIEASSHTHAIADVTDLAETLADLSGRIPTSSLDPMIAALIFGSA